MWGNRAGRVTSIWSMRRVQPLVLDLHIDHDRYGSSADPSVNVTLHYPTDVDRSLNESSSGKIRKYRTDYNNGLPKFISFIETAKKYVCPVPQ